MAQYKHPDEDKRSNEEELLSGLLNRAVDTAVAAPLSILRTGHEVGGGLLSILEGGVDMLTGGSFKEGLLRGSERYKTPDWMRNDPGDAQQDLIHKGMELVDKPFQMFGEGVGAGATMLGASPGTAEWAKEIAYWTTSLVGPKGMSNVAKMVKVPTSELARHLKIYRDGWYTNKAMKPLQIGAIMPGEAAVSRAVSEWSPYYMSLLEDGLSPSASASIARSTADIAKTGKVNSKDARIIFNEVANQYGQLLAAGKPIPMHLEAAARLVFPSGMKSTVDASGSIPNINAALSTAGFQVGDDISSLIGPLLRREYDLKPGTNIEFLNKVESGASTGRMMSGQKGGFKGAQRVPLDGTNPNYAWMERDLVGADWPSYIHKEKGKTGRWQPERRELDLKARKEGYHRPKAYLEQNQFRAMEASWKSLNKRRDSFPKGYRFTADDMLGEIDNINRKISSDYSKGLAAWKEAGGSYKAAKKGVEKPKPPVFFVRPSKGDGVTEVADNVKNDPLFTLGDKVEKVRGSGHVRFTTSAKTGDYLLGTVRATHILDPDTGRMYVLAHDQLDLGSNVGVVEKTLRSTMKNRVISLTAGKQSFSGLDEGEKFYPAKGAQVTGSSLEESVAGMLALIFQIDKTKPKVSHYLQAADKSIGRGSRVHVQAEKERERKNNRMRN